MKRVSKGFYLGSYIGGSILGVIFLLAGFFFLWAAADSESHEVAKIGLGIFLTGVSLIIYVTFVSCKLLFKAWGLIQDGFARTTPGKAIGFLFIPFFNFYWIFRAIWGFAKDYNWYVTRHKITATQLPEKLFLIACILWLPEIISLMAYILWLIPNPFLFAFTTSVKEPGVSRLPVISDIFYSLFAFFDFLPLATFVVFSLVINKVCNAINAIYQATEVSK